MKIERNNLIEAKDHMDTMLIKEWIGYSEMQLKTIKQMLEIANNLNRRVSQCEHKLKIVK